MCGGNNEKKHIHEKWEEKKKIGKDGKIRSLGEREGEGKKERKQSKWEKGRQEDWKKERPGKTKMRLYVCVCVFVER